MIPESAFNQILGDVNGVSIEEMITLFNIAVQYQLKANEVYIRDGESSKKLAFIEKGIIRTYAVKDNGDEATLLLRWEGQFIASHDTIILGQPSRFVYRALENTSIFEIDYDVLENILHQNTKYERLRIYFLMKMLGEALQLAESFILFTPEERYLNLMKEKYDIVNRVPDKYLASLLGITPVSLSRIRKRILLKQKN